ncbi:hypothetical protein [Neomegalonema sp.]|uniref:hypothetical protein n=1 Tax=Neomegalonema sp. TaxID=2039713 RepID=UPI00263429D0|nr:hypothetical protein [Neomegalonema sp.]MDD2868693.1 hypothetical protein [Neomegalonema sp.]
MDAELTWTGARFAPLVPLWALGLLAALVLALLALGLWRRAPGVWLRFAAGLAVLTALAGPSLVKELREPRASVAALILDETASDGVDERPERLAAAEAAMRAAVERMNLERPMELKVIRVSSAMNAAGHDLGSPIFGALNEILAETDPERIAGAVVVSDGRAHDAALAGFPAPVHLLSTGRAGEYDRRLLLESAPSFAVVRENIPIRIRVEDQGAAPTRPGQSVVVNVRVNGEIAVQQSVTLGVSETIMATVNAPGLAAVEVSVEPLAGQLTGRNDRAAFTLRAARERLRVLLVSGAPHAGQRAWRNLLKADPAVDLVHFTILRPIEKDPGAGSDELSLIPFPTRELFMEKLDDFDLVIFDRYAERDILDPTYIMNVARYIRAGGAALITAGPEFAGVDSLERSPLGATLPARPTGRLLEGAFRPRLTVLGGRHPVTSDLARAWPPSEESAGAPGWGSWLRIVEVEPREEATALMESPEGEPLLILDRVGRGRVALLSSDTIWLWARGFEGGGPQAELFRRLAHWLMKEPELEEDALIAEVVGARIGVTRRSLAEEGPERARVVTPSGVELLAPFEAAGPGLWRAEVETPELGVHVVTDGEWRTLAAVGGASPREFENAVSTDEIFRPLLDATGGASLRVAEGLPDIRRAQEGRPTEGRGWIGLVERDASVLRAASLTPLPPAWLALLIAAGLLLAAWRREGR